MANNDDYAPLIPPGGGGGAPLGPGAMVANSLQQILAQRRAQSQQDIINQLAQQKQTAEIQHWNNMDAYNEESRAALAEERRQRSEDRIAANARRERFGATLKSLATTTTPPTNPLTGPVDPTDTTDQTGPSQQPVPLTSKFDPQQQAAFQILQAVGADDPKSPELLNTLLSRFVKPEQEYEPEMIWDAQHNKAVPTGRQVKKGDRIQIEGINQEQFHPTQDHGTFLDRPVMTPDPNNPGQFVEDRSKVYVMRNGQITIEPIPGGGALGPKPRVGGKAVPPYDKTRVGNLISQYGKPGFQEAINGFLPTVANEHMRNDIRGILADPVAKNKTTDEILAQVTPPPDLQGNDAQEYLNNLRDLLQLVRKK